MSLYDRRVDERGKSITAMIRLVIEIVAVVWAVSGLNAATNNLKDSVAALSKVVESVQSKTFDLDARVKVLEAAKKEK